MAIDDAWRDPGQDNCFHYSYCAPQQEEVKRIREKYLPKEETPLEQLRRLDACANQRAMAPALAVGTLGALVLGLGMCCCMVWGGMLYLPGILIGTAGLAGVSLAYPLYAAVTRRERARIAPEILRLTDELLK